jgi:hypothetical protein
MVVASSTRPLSHSAPTARSRTRLLTLVAFVLLLAFSSNEEYQIYYMSHMVAGQELIAASRGVLSGHPPWKAFQARLLGPVAFAAFGYAINWIRVVCPAVYEGFVRVFSLPDTRNLAVLNGFVAMMIVAKNILCFTLLRRYTGSIIKATGGTLLGSLLFILLSNYWLYMWDLFEPIFFSVLAYLEFNRPKPALLFFVIFALSLANRESAAFFGVWLLCYAGAHWLINRHYLWREVAIGLVMIAITVIYVETLRQHLLVESTLGHETAANWRPSAIHLRRGNEVHQAFGNHLFLLDNVKEFAKNLISTHFYVNIILIALVSHGVMISRLGIIWRSAQLLGIGIFNLFLLFSIVNFAALNETRLFLICIPFVVFSVVTFGSELMAFLSRLDDGIAGFSLGRASNSVGPKLASDLIVEPKPNLPSEFAKDRRGPPISAKFIGM